MSCELTTSSGLRKRRVRVNGIEYEYDISPNHGDASTNIYFNRVGSSRTQKAGVRNFYVEDGCVGTGASRLGFTMDDVVIEAVKAWLAGNRAKLLCAEKNTMEALSNGV